MDPPVLHDPWPIKKQMPGLLGPGKVWVPLSLPYGEHFLQIINILGPTQSSLRWICILTTQTPYFFYLTTPEWNWPHFPAQNVWWDFLSSSQSLRPTLGLQLLRTQSLTQHRERQDNSQIYHFDLSCVYSLAFFSWVKDLFCFQNVSRCFSNCIKKLFLLGYFSEAPCLSVLLFSFDCEV